MYVYICMHAVLTKRGPTLRCKYDTQAKMACALEYALAGFGIEYRLRCVRWMLRAGTPSHHTHTHTHTHTHLTPHDPQPHSNVSHTAAHYNTPRHAATHCSTLQHTAAHGNEPHPLDTGTHTHTATKYAERTVPALIAIMRVPHTSAQMKPRVRQKTPATLLLKGATHNTSVSISPVDVQKSPVNGGKSPDISDLFVDEMEPIEVQEANCWREVCACPHALQHTAAYCNALQHAAT